MGRWSKLAAAGLLSLAATVRPAPARAGGAFPDVPLVDQDGREVLLHRDLLEGKVLVLSSFFTSCPIVCPKVMRRLRGVRSWLGDRAGREVHLVSFSVDPETDTPQRLRRYAERHRIDWTLVTGEPENVDRALRELGFYSDMAENHTSIVLVADERRGTWRKADGYEGRRRDITRLVRQALEERR